MLLFFYNSPVDRCHHKHSYAFYLTWSYSLFVNNHLLKSCITGCHHLTQTHCHCGQDAWTITCRPSSLKLVFTSSLTPQRLSSVGYLVMTKHTGRYNEHVLLLDIQYAGLNLKRGKQFWVTLGCLFIWLSNRPVLLILVCQNCCGCIFIPLNFNELGKCFTERWL